MTVFDKVHKALWYAQNFMMKRSDIAAVWRCDAAATGSPPFWPDGFGHTVKKKKSI